eukprot:14308752-Heterocapsa_arctica.AAC.1
MHQQGEHQGNPVEEQESRNTEHIGSGAQEEEPVPHQKHKGSQTDSNPVIGSHTGGTPLSQRALEQIWWEGYEAARK